MAFMTGAEAPAIGSVTPSGVLEGTNTLLLWASGVTERGDFQRVVCDHAAGL